MLLIAFMVRNNMSHNSNAMQCQASSRDLFPISPLAANVGGLNNSTPTIWGSKCPLGSMTNKEIEGLYVTQVRSGTSSVISRLAGGKNSNVQLLVLWPQNDLRCAVAHIMATL